MISIEQEIPGLKNQEILNSLLVSHHNHNINSLKFLTYKAKNQNPTIQAAIDSQFHQINKIQSIHRKFTNSLVSKQVQMNHQTDYRDILNEYESIILNSRFLCQDKQIYIFEEIDALHETLPTDYLLLSKQNLTKLTCQQIRHRKIMKLLDIRGQVQQSLQYHQKYPKNQLNSRQTATSFDITVQMANRFIKNLQSQISERLIGKLYDKISEFDAKFDELSQKYSSYSQVYNILKEENNSLRQQLRLKSDSIKQQILLSRSHQQEYIDDDDDVDDIF